MKRKDIIVILSSIIVITIIAGALVIKNTGTKVEKTASIQNEGAISGSGEDAGDKEEKATEEERLAEETRLKEKAEKEAEEQKEKEEKAQEEARLAEEKKKQEEEERKKQEEEKKKLEEKNKTPKLPTGNTKYYIKVNYQANAVTIYEKDNNGYYTVPVKAMICSCGTATPKSGVYKTSRGYEWGTLEGGTFGRYSTRIVGGILFHSVPYVRMYEDNSLEYWEYDKLGTTASLGCVRLAVSDCKWIFDNVEVGTQVEFYANSNPGPLGKPSAKKISDNEECRDWDPTDTSPNSPWNK